MTLLLARFSSPTVCRVIARCIVKRATGLPYRACMICTRKRILMHMKSLPAVVQRQPVSEAGGTQWQSRHACIVPRHRLQLTCVRSYKHPAMSSYQAYHTGKPLETYTLDSNCKCIPTKEPGSPPGCSRCTTLVPSCPDILEHLCSFCAAAAPVALQVSQRPLLRPSRAWLTLPFQRQQQQLPFSMTTMSARRAGISASPIASLETISSSSSSSRDSVRDSSSSSNRDSSSELQVARLSFCHAASQLPTFPWSHLDPTARLPAVATAVDLLKHEAEVTYMRSTQPPQSRTSRVQGPTQTDQAAAGESSSSTNGAPMAVAAAAPATAPAPASLVGLDDLMSQIKKMQALITRYGAYN